MFERFTDRARRVVVLAQDEARDLGHGYIGTEHLLLGLVREGDGVAGRALTDLGISLEGVRFRTREIIGEGTSSPAGHIPFTSRAKKVLELSLREALQLGHNYIGTEHILLGLIREGEGVGAQVLVGSGADLERVRERILQVLGSASTPEPLIGGARRSGGRVRGRLRGGRGWPLAPHSALAMDVAARIARSMGERDIEPIDILWALLRGGDPAVLAALEEMGADVDASRRRIEELLRKATREPPAQDDPLE